MLDHNNVVNALSFNEASMVGVGLDHLNDDGSRIPSILCSFGKNQSYKAFDDGDYYPVIRELWGYVSTDEDLQPSHTIEIYPFREEPTLMAGKAIRMTGYKSTVPTLLGVPSILFDDKEDNITRMRKDILAIGELL